MTPTPATKADLPAIMGLEQAFDHARWSEDAWAEELASPRACVLLERDAEGRVVGVVTFTRVEEVADLNRVVVAPDARRAGIGRRLVLAGLAWAAEHGVQQVMLEVDADNAPAIALYDSVGFTRLATRANYYGAGRDALVMALRLEDRHE
ncbi:MAG: GNAT family N-acetyltransferase [Mobilicoccus sp.]|nr:GNAT family N-acetyltransferase [Mobilicoccus sp.]